jgi:hypothetical protein
MNWSASSRRGDRWSGTDERSSLAPIGQRRGAAAAMKKDWGFAALLEIGGRRILFDAGNNPDVFAHNVKAAGVDLGKLDFVVMSHRHGDHMGGMTYLLDRRDADHAGSSRLSATHISMPEPVLSCSSAPTPVLVLGKVELRASPSSPSTTSARRAIGDRGRRGSCASHARRASPHRHSRDRRR